MSDRGDDALPGLDLPAALAWLDRHVPGTTGPATTARLIAGGRSNLTYLLEDGACRLVLRRPPLGHVLATAHDMSREYRVIGALDGTPVPVPRTVALCPDPAVTGAPFYVMEHVEGRVVRRHADVADVDDAGRARLAEAMVGTLVALHDVDPAAVGLGDLGRPEGFLERQVHRWSRQREASRSRDLPGLDAFRDDVAAAVPAAAGPGGLVHGDFRLDNLIVAGPRDQDPLTVRAVLDWEMATLGDPLTDLGLLLTYWEVLSGLGTEFGGATVVSDIGPGSGFPSGAELVHRYATLRGTEPQHLDWYVAFGVFKLAVILEGIHYRYSTGATVGDGFADIGRAVPPLVEAGRERLAGC